MSAATLPRADLRKGWCPGALRPMLAMDGLLVRLRITGGIVPAHVARGLADLAETWGNGLFDLSARANLQMRGVRDDTLPPLLDGLRGLDLLDDDAESEAIRNIIASPLAGLGSGLDIRPITTALDAALTGDRGLHGLPGKFGFLIDDGGAPTLATVAADVRFDWSAVQHAFAVSLGGTRDDASFAGFCAAEAVVARAQDIARKVVALRIDAQPARRMSGLLRDLGPAAADIFDTQPHRPFAPGASLPAIAGRHTFGSQGVLGLAVPFGRLDAAMLRTAAASADAELGELRLTPWRAILVPLAHQASPVVPAGFISDPADPLLRVVACVGRDGCARGTTPTHADATSLADLAVKLGALPTPLHVSGCEKGCAKPSRSAVTLVGREGRYDLVRDGRPGDAPALRGLDSAQVRAALTRTSLQVPA